MISCHYIWRKTFELNIHLRLTRHMLSSPVTKQSRTAFVEEEVRRTEQGAKRTALQDGRDPESVFEQVVREVYTNSFGEYCTANFQQFVEFGEYRLNQMELLLRYSVFESLYLNVVGNILWEYENAFLDACIFLHPDVRKNRKLTAKHVSAGMDKIARAEATERLVSGIDHLLFAEEVVPRDRANPSTGPFVREFVSNVLHLGIEQQIRCPILERAREIRNRIVHADPDTPLSDDRMAQLRTHLADFPLVLCKAAVALYPDACTMGALHEDDDGRLGYKSLLSLRDLL